MLRRESTTSENAPWRLRRNSAVFVRAASSCLILLCCSVPAAAQATAGVGTPASVVAAVTTQVTCAQGLLTITAENSSLAEILNAVRSRTGASVEFPPAASDERATLKLGPALPAKVLADLLRGSPFDYLVVGSGPELNRLHVVLSEKSQSAGTQIVSAPDVSLPDVAVAEARESGSLTVSQAQPTGEPSPAIGGAFLNAPLDETVFTAPGEVQSDGRPKRVRRQESPRYFPPLNKQQQ